MTERTIRTPEGVDLHTRIDGPVDTPPLLVVNSLGTDLASWDGQVERWARDRRVLRYDQRGHGRSVVPPGPYSIDDLGQDAVAVLDAHGVERADVCGLSLGGVVALWLAVHAPSRVRRVVLADTAARVGTAEAWQARAATVRAHGMDAVVDAVLERFFSPGFRAAEPDVVERVADGLRGTAPEGYAACCDALAAADLRSVADRATAPCLVVVGSEDVATPPTDAQTLRDLLGAAGYLELPGSGHLANLERPADFADLVTAFLAAERFDQETSRA